MDWAETWRVVVPMIAPLSGVALGAWGLLRGSRLLNEIKELTELRSHVPEHLQGELDGLIAQQLNRLVARRSRKVNVNNAFGLAVVVIITGAAIAGLAFWSSHTDGIWTILLNLAITMTAALGLLLCAVGVMTLFDDPVQTRTNR